MVFQAEAWRVRLAGMGMVVGVDLTIATRKLMQAGIAEELAGDLLAACERGMVAALNEKDDEDGE